MKFLNQKYLIVGCLLGIGLFPMVNEVKADEDKLSEKQYVDPKGYFKLMPPEGWLTQEFKNDPRRKVKFVPSSSSHTMVLVMAQRSHFQDLKELLEDTERAGIRLKEKMGVSAEIQKTIFANVEAMRLTVEIPFKLKQIQYQFLMGDNYYTIVYGAPPKRYSQFLPIAMTSIETFEPILGKADKEDSVEHVVASKLRTAEGLIQLGQTDYALIVINEGLELDPQNDRLLKMQESIDGR